MYTSLIFSHWVTILFSNLHEQNDWPGYLKLNPSGYSRQRSDPINYDYSFLSLIYSTGWVSDEVCIENTIFSYQYTYIASYSLAQNVAICSKQNDC